MSVAAAHSTDRVVGAQQVLRRDLAHRKNDFWLNQLYLSFQVRSTSSCLRRLGVPIIRRPTLENVGNEHAFTTLPDRNQHLIEQLAGPAYERFAPPILFGPRRFADD